MLPIATAPFSTGFDPLGTPGFGPSMPGFGALDRLGPMGFPNPALQGFMQAEMALQNCMCKMLQMMLMLMLGGAAPGGIADGLSGLTGGAPSGGASSGASGPSGGGGPSGAVDGGGFGAANPTADISQFSGGTDFGRQIAAAAQNQAGSMNSRGWCLRGVRLALEKVGVQIGGASAYMAADQLARNPKFREVQVSREQLKSLPPGAIVVWNKSGAHPHGHISVALGNGREASDHIQSQITNLSGSSFRVFMPV